MFRFLSCISFSTRLSLPPCISRQKGRSQSTYYTLYSRTEIIKELSQRTLIIPREMIWAWVNSHAPSIRSHKGNICKWFFPDFQPMRVSEEPVCIDLFRQNPVFTSPAFEISRSSRIPPLGLIGQKERLRNMPIHNRSTICQSELYSCFGVELLDSAAIFQAFKQLNMC